MQQCRTVDFPDVQFIGGSSQEFEFAVLNEDGEPLDISSATCIWSMSDYTKRNTIPDIILTGTIINDASDIYPYRFVVFLDGYDTRLLEGKFMHQAKIIDVFGKTFVPGQGFIIIRKNTNPLYSGRYWYNNISTIFVDNVQPMQIRVGDRDRINVKYVDSTTSVAIPAPRQDLEYISNNPLIAETSVQGEVIGHSIGETSIRVNVRARPQFTAEAIVNVF